ncbi:MAG: hypothetical protein ACI9CD_000065 [Candidatus Deianiraeaceae bacterium]|jgi:hypothetical protein
MNAVVVIVEEEFIKSSHHFGKSGDLAIVDYFIRQGWQVFLLNANFMKGESIPQSIYKVVSYNDTFYEAMVQEWENILNKKTPSYSCERLKVNLELHEVSLFNVQNFLLISRVMPQSLTQQFLYNFNTLKKIAKASIQNMEDICLYKDKVIPYLLQKNNIHNIQTIYSNNVVKFKTDITNDYSSLALATDIINIDQISDSDIVNIDEKICIKPFNLFGGIGVKVFNKSNKETIIQHLRSIRKFFAQYNIVEEKLVLLQEVVQFPEFGDIRVLFSYGKFIGAFKRFEPNAQIHNTMYGGSIIPICRSDFLFDSEFPHKYHQPLLEAIQMLISLNTESRFLMNEFVCGYDLLLTECNGQLQFKLTETNIACPTGFAFLDAANLFVFYKKKPTLESVKEYFHNNQRTIDIVMNNVHKSLLSIALI